MKKIAIVPFILCSSLLFSGCKKEEEKKKQYDDIRISLNDFFTISDSYYCIYFSSSFCEYCERMKDDFDSYLLKERDYKTYYLSADDDPNMKWFDSSDGIVEKTIGVNSLENLYFYQTPSIYLIKNNQIEKFLYEMSSIREYLKNY